MEQTSPQENKAPHANAESNQTLMAVLAYLGILIIIPFIMAKNDPFVKFHIKQGLVLVIIEIAVWVLSTMIVWQLWQILQLVNLATLILSIVGIINVINHKEAELPLVGSFGLSFNI